MQMKADKRLLLNKELYERDIILLTAKQYRGLAAVKINDKGNYWECEFLKCKYDAEVTIREFENYAIDLANVRN